MKIQPVAIEWVPAVWPRVRDFVASALEHSGGDYTPEQAQTLLATGQWLLLVAVADDGSIQGAATVQLFNRPNDRVAFITSIGGRLVSNQETFAQLKAALAAQGATCIEGAARESIARLWKRYGFAPKYQIVGVKL